MKILVSGGAGFIGSNVVDGYVENGHQVVVVDDLSSGARENVNPDAVFYHEDIRSPRMQEIFEKERPEILNHHAAQISVPASVEDPLTDADINIKGFLNLLECAVKYGTNKVIFISSGGAIYGEAEEYPTSENYPPQPLSPYAVAKFCSEKYRPFTGTSMGSNTRPCAMQISMGPGRYRMAKRALWPYSWTISWKVNNRFFTTLRVSQMA